MPLLLPPKGICFFFWQEEERCFLNSCGITAALTRRNKDKTKRQMFYGEAYYEGIYYKLKSTRERGQRKTLHRKTTLKGRLLKDDSDYFTFLKRKLLQERKRSQWAWPQTCQEWRREKKNENRLMAAIYEKREDS